ncbi:response regulator [Humisphaera borealis]|uniref:Response regulator n=1 Tax=Humisphaera borealis TaxID=2807512 RepID=A0A7M2WWA1_9BACT|nr:response regulator [Humisphaera borealis]QOV88780.1 response regulator [Humisphaera borealis]
MTKILVIDDAPAMRSSLSRALRKEGFEVLAADDGLQAIGYVANRPPDLIILDINMPRMNGIEVLKRLRQNMLWRTVPVLVFSGSPNAMTLQQARDLGAVEVLLKGETQVSELSAKIRALTGSGERLAPAV